MRKARSFLSLGTVSTFVLGFVIPFSALAGGNCQDKFVGKSAVASTFTCTVKFSNGSSMSECWTFAQANLSQYFDIYTEALPSGPELPHYGCACDTTGSIKSPQFNNSLDAFECDDGNGDQLQGKLKGKKLSGQSSDDEGNSQIFSCTPNTGCG